MGIKDINTIYTTNDLASGEVMFSATGVTDGTLLKGVLIRDNFATTQSVVMRSKTKTLRYVNSRHDLGIKNIITYPLNRIITDNNMVIEAIAGVVPILNEIQ